MEESLGFSQSRKISHPSNSPLFYAKSIELFKTRKKMLLCTHLVAFDCSNTKSSKMFVFQCCLVGIARSYLSKKNDGFWQCKQVETLDGAAIVLFSYKEHK